MFEPDSHERNLLARVSLDHCVKCTICETQCPVAAVTPLFPGPKAIGPQAERFRAGKSVDRSIDYCSSCGTCTLVCPQGVLVAEMNSAARAAMKARAMPLRDQLISRTVLMGRLLTPLAPLANAGLRWRWTRVVMEKVLGIHRDAAMPTARRRTFSGWWKRHRAPAKGAWRGQVVFFSGCAGNYFEVETSVAAVEVLERLGFEVIVPDQGCCGLALQSNGLYDAARGCVRKLASALSAAGGGVPIVSTAGSCAGMVKHEAREILGVEDEVLAEVGARTREFSEFLLEVGDLPELGRIEKRVAYHAPCQVRGQGMGSPAVTLLRMIPGLEVVESTAACCGMAGTYGVKKEKHAIAMAVGESVFSLVRDVNPELGVCDTETCRWHIAKATGAQMVHPAVLLREALSCVT
ncbi:MAG: anaerobic glycerol-3-phosphate dehydrogenase subunit C [Micrococcales bacterium]|nr:anaerobic glycerol-3-phosphate dehydrogenase subunit C [Micrococcales bacterium]